MQRAKAPNTFKAYKHGWKVFSAWCRDWRHCEPLPASPEVVRNFITWAAMDREPAYSPTTIQVAITAIKRQHVQAGFAAPVDEATRDLMSAVLRKAAREGPREEEAGKKHLRIDQLKKLCSALRGTEPIVVRDRAIILTGFASGLRRSDLSRLQTRHVHFEGGRVRLWVPYSKGDQLGQGRDVYLDPAGIDPLLCPVRALEDWKKLRMEYFGNFRGPLFVRFDWHSGITEFPLGDQAICEVLQRRLASAGEEARDYGAHSMRSGMITSAHAAGANLRSIMDRTGHKSVDSIIRYVKSAPKSNPLAGVL